MSEKAVLGELIAFATERSSRQVDQEMARRNPQAAAREKVRPLSAEKLQLTITLKQETFLKIERARALAAQCGKSTETEYGDVLEEVLEMYLQRRDPVQKAQRSQNRKSAQAAQKVQDAQANLDSESGSELRSTQFAEKQQISLGAAAKMHVVLGLESDIGAASEAGPESEPSIDRGSKARENSSPCLSTMLFG